MNNFNLSEIKKVCEQNHKPDRDLNVVLNIKVKSLHKVNSGYLGNQKKSLGTNDYRGGGIKQALKLSFKDISKKPLKFLNYYTNSLKVLFLGGPHPCGVGSSPLLCVICYNFLFLYMLPACVHYNIFFFFQDIFY